jgi:hypothetical protein
LGFMLSQKKVWFHTCSGSSSSRKDTSCVRQRVLWKGIVWLHLLFLTMLWAHMTGSLPSRRGAGSQGGNHSKIQDAGFFSEACITELTAESLWEDF